MYDKGPMPKEKANDGYQNGKVVCKGVESRTHHTDYLIPAGEITINGIGKETESQEPFKYNPLFGEDK